MFKARKKYNLFTGKALLFLILPIMIESAFTMSLGLIDGLMVTDIQGAPGEAALTAVNYVDQISSLIIQLFSAFGVGGAIITSQYLGAGKISDANKSAKQLLNLMFFSALAVTVVCLLLIKPIINLFFGELDQTTLDFSYRYFFITTLSYPFIALHQSSAALLRAQRKSLSTMISSGASFFVNIILNALFIYGLKSSIDGVAIATLIARAVSAVVLILSLIRKNNIVRVNFLQSTKIYGGLLKKIAKLAVPSGIENSFFQLGKIMVLSFISLKCYNIVINGSEVNFHSAANASALGINTLASIVGNGINVSILTVIGQAVGQGIYEQVKFYMRKMLTLSYIGNAISVSIVWMLSPLILSAYNISSESTELAMKCLNLCFAFQLVAYPLSFGLPSILKATSDVRYVMICSIISMLFMRVGLCYILTTDLLPFKLGALGLWIGMVSDWVLRGIFFLIRLLSGKWKTQSGLLDSQTATSQ